MLRDQKARMSATCPRSSYIVQAPAGSGKTEILTQRFLRLLPSVQAPEQIIAITFTKKAANEMHERIMGALENAAMGHSPTSDHQALTFDYANKALAWDKKNNWQLLKHPQRLSIFTIDSLCQRITRAIPLQEKQIPYANIATRPEQHYRTAAKNCLEHALSEPEYQADILCLLSHLDNHQERLVDLFTNLLTNRDQWLAPLHQAKTQDKAEFEQALAWIEQHELQRLQDAAPISYQEELVELINLLASVSTAPENIQKEFKNWRCFKSIGRTKASLLAQTLLTTQGKLRKRFDHRLGVRKGACAPEIYERLKSSSEDLFSTLSEYPSFIEALLRVKHLPSPEYDLRQWEVLQSLFAVLPLLAAHLHLTFSENNEVDFSSISQQALSALGTEELPTDLALYLDNHIQHLLIDEFQDTSIQQFELLEKLVIEWQAGDGKTLFLVGDPMQSIYRFRAAEVGLFLLAQKKGVGPVKLTPLELTANFRSTANIVSWNNQQFFKIFPAQDDIESGAVSFSNSDIIQPESTDSFVIAKEAECRDTQAQSVIEVIKEELSKRSEESIAILVRSRRELREIIVQLRAENIPFQGVDIDLLAHLPHIRDVYTLTQALLMPANRLAWLSLMRTPWCGLSLADLHALANYSKKQSIYYALSQKEALDGLSLEGKARAQNLFHTLQYALANRHQKSLVNWLLDALKQLQTDKIYDEATQQDFEAFYELLEQFEDHGQLGDLKAFREALNRLFSKKVTPSNIQIMTIHKSKGLEFDTVILPGLSSKLSSSEKPLFRWLNLPSAEQNHLLLSPIKAAEQDECLLFNYIEKIDAEKERYELQRLLYVATTRAKKRLYLFDYKEKGSKGSFRELFKEVFFEPMTLTQSTPIEESKTNYPVLNRLPLEAFDSKHHEKSIQITTPNLDTELSFSRQMGIAIHELLQWICNHHPTNLSQVPWNIAFDYLKRYDCNDEIILHVKQAIEKQIHRLFNDTKGQWIIKPHAEERNEYPLLVKQDGEVITKVLDRTFVDSGIRWIVDFKTGHENQKSNELYEKQVNEYAKILLSKDPTYPVHCGLYYLETGHWHDWKYQPEPIKN